MLIPVFLSYATAKCVPVTVPVLTGVAIFISEVNWPFAISTSTLPVLRRMRVETFGCARERSTANLSSVYSLNASTVIVTPPPIPILTIVSSPVKICAFSGSTYGSEIVPFLTPSLSLIIVSSGSITSVSPEIEMIAPKSLPLSSSKSVLVFFCGFVFTSAFVYPLNSESSTVWTVCAGNGDGNGDVEIGVGEDAEVVGAFGCEVSGDGQVVLVRHSCMAAEGHAFRQLSS